MIIRHLEKIPSVFERYLISMKKGRDTMPIP
jgi:hypothetical protein